MIDFIEKSGDSILENYSFSDSNLIVELKCETDENLILSVNTDVICVNSFYLQKEEEFYRTCHIEMKQLSNVLKVKDGFFVPPADFTELLIETRANYNLAYGKKKNQYEYIFTLVGYGNLISCLIKNIDSIDVLSWSEL